MFLSHFNISKCKIKIKYFKAKNKYNYLNLD